MTVESVTYISDLNASYPASGDSLVEGDDHIRNLKTGIKATFPNISGAVMLTHTAINALVPSGLVLIASSTASGSAAIDFTSGINSTYDEYELHVVNALPSGASGIPWVRTSADGGSTFASTSGDYNWISGRLTGTSVTVTNDGATGTAIVLHNASVSTTQPGYSAVIKFFQPASTSNHKTFSFSGAIGAAATREASFGGGTRPATAAINAIRFMFASGNITSGEFKLYGVKKS